MSGFCEIKKELMELSKEQRKLINRTKNEQAISEIIVKSDPLTDGEKDFIFAELGKNGLALAMKINGVISEQLNSGTSMSEAIEIAMTPTVSGNSEISQLMDLMQTDPYINARLQAVSLNKPDPKYNDISLSIDISSTESLTTSLKNIISSIIGKHSDSRLRKRNDRIMLEVEKIKEALSGDISEEDRNSMITSLQNLSNKMTNQDIANSLSALGIKFFNDLVKSDMSFKPIFASHETQSNKNITGGKDLATLKAEREAGYDSSKVDAFEIVGNSVVGVSYKRNADGTFDKSNKIYLDANGDDISPLAVLFGVNSSGKYGTAMVNIPKFLKNSIRINSIGVMQDIYKSLGHEVDSREFEEIWGIDRNSDDYDEKIDEIETYYRAGAIPRAMIVNSLGNAIYKSLPVKFSVEIDFELKQKAITELGLYAIEFMKESNLALVPDVNIVYNDGTKTQTLVMVNHRSADDTGIVKARDIMPVITALEYLDLNEGRSGYSREPIVDIKNTIRNSMIEKPQPVKDKQLKMQSNALQFTKDAEKLVELYDQDPELAYAFSGVLSVDTSKPIYDQMKELSKINYGKMQVDALVEIFKDIEDGSKILGEKGNDFYLKYDYTVSGRYMIDSILNPQESKITRFLVTSDDLRTTISMENGLLNKDELDKFKLGLSQAFDLDPDKTTDESAIADLESNVVKISQDGTFVFAKDKNGNDSIFQKAYDLIKKLHASGSDVFKRDVDGTTRLNDEFKSTMMELNASGSGFHGVQALMALYDLATFKRNNPSGDASFVSNFTLESDAITSGMIITLMQIGTKNAIELAQKGGIYTKEVVAKWESLVDQFNQIDGVEKFTKTLSDKNGNFKITHGWLKSFSKHVETQLSKPSFNGNSEAQQVLKQAIFTDVYETVGRAAKDELGLIENDLNNELISLTDEVKALDKDVSSGKQDSNIEFKLNVLSRKIDYAHMRIAIVKTVGEIKRKTAKPPTMVYIYGAMLSSIRKKLTGSVLVPKLYEYLNSKDVRDLSIADLYAKMAVQSKTLNDTNNPESNMTRLLISVLSDTGTTYKRFDGIDFKDIDVSEATAKDIVLSGKGIDSLSKASEATIGAAFEKGFSEFGEIDNFRESIKFLEVVRFSIFKHKYRKAIQRAIKSFKKSGEDYKISDSDIARIIDELEKEGFGHSVDDINGGKQPLYSKEKLKQNLRAILHTQVSQRGKDIHSSVSSDTEGKEFGPNTGASGVITVHSLDGFIDATSSAAFNLIRIYDGSVSSINKLEAQGDAYNETFVSATTEWDTYNSQARLIQKDIESLIESNELSAMLRSMSEFDKDKISTTITKLMGYKDIEFLSVKHDLPLQAKQVISRISEKKSYKKDSGAQRSVYSLHQYLSDKSDPVESVLSDEKNDGLTDNSVESIYSTLGSIVRVLQKDARFAKYGAEVSGLQRNIETISFGSENQSDKKSRTAIMSAYKKIEKQRPAIVYAGAINRSDSIDGTAGVKYADDFKVVNKIEIPVKKKNSGRDADYTNSDIDLAIIEIDKAFDLIPSDRDIIIQRGISSYIKEPTIKKYLDDKIDKFMETSTSHVKVDYKKDAISQDQKSAKIDVTTTDASKIGSNVEVSKAKEAFIESMTGIMSKEKAIALADSIIADC